MLGDFKRKHIRRRQIIEVVEVSQKMSRLTAEA
jgi:hypothetical protein